MSAFGYKFVRHEGSAAMAETLAPSKAFRLLGVKLHLSAVGGTSEDFTITVDSGVSADYDIQIHATDMNAESDVLFFPAYPLIFEDGDELDFAYANTNTKDWGLEVIYMTEG